MSVILNQYYVNGHLAYYANGICCAYCDLMQPQKRIKNRFGQTVGFTLQDDWYHSFDCPQKDLPNTEEVQMSSDPIAQARNEQFEVEEINLTKSFEDGAEEVESSFLKEKDFDDL